MSKMPFLPYLRMHALNLESTSDADRDNISEGAETRHSLSRSGKDAMKHERTETLAAMNRLSLGFQRR